MSNNGLSVYRDLGVKPVINAMGFMTVLGGSRPSPGSSGGHESRQPVLRRHGRSLEKNG